jgi:hypothetical protein
MLDDEVMVNRFPVKAPEPAETTRDEQLVAARAAAEKIRADAERDAEAIRRDARRDAEDITAAAAARIRRAVAIAEGRAAERIDAAEYAALEIRRAAWRLAALRADSRSHPG